MRKLEGGRVHIAVKGGREKTEVLKSEIAKKIEGAEVKLRANETTIFVYGIEEGITKEELLAAITDQTGIQATELGFKGIRPTKLGSGIATLGVHKRSAHLLLDKGRIRIG